MLQVNFCTYNSCMHVRGGGSPLRSRHAQSEQAHGAFIFFFASWRKPSSLYLGASPFFFFARARDAGVHLDSLQAKLKRCDARTTRT